MKRRRASERVEGRVRLVFLKCALHEIQVSLYRHHQSVCLTLTINRSDSYAVSEVRWLLGTVLETCSDKHGSCYTAVVHMQSFATLKSFPSFIKLLLCDNCRKS